MFILTCKWILIHRNVKNVLKLSEQELQTNRKTSWHDEYKKSAWIFVGGLPYDLTEGDVITIFSQYVLIILVVNFYYQVSI